MPSKRRADGEMARSASVVFNDPFGVTRTELADGEIGMAHWVEVGADISSEEGGGRETERERGRESGRETEWERGLEGGRDAEKRRGRE